MISENDLNSEVSSEISQSSVAISSVTQEPVAYAFYQGEIDEEGANKQNEIE
jgi:hypothetical protein